MEDFRSKAISQANQRGAFLSESKLSRLSAIQEEAAIRINIVRLIGACCKEIVVSAARILVQEKPFLVAPGGPAYSSRRMAACLRDMEIILRYISYSIVTGDASVLKERCLDGLRETYISLGVPTECAAVSVILMQEALFAILQKDGIFARGKETALQEEIGSLFDKAIFAILDLEDIDSEFENGELTNHDFTVESGGSGEGLGIEEEGSSSGHETIEIFYATDRQRADRQRIKKIYGSSRSICLSYGICIVSIPRKHRLGQLERPALWKLEFRENPDKHIILKTITPLPFDEFISEVSLRASKIRQAFIFVHGFNVTFIDAARRTAQMAYDLQFNGIPLFYSWPSMETIAGYTSDEATIEWSRANLYAFLEHLIEESGLDHIFLIAHSMGNRSMTYAISRLIAEKPSYADKISEIILAAPDIDRGVFENQVGPSLGSRGSGVTLYCSSNDKALEASQAIHSYPRAGQSDGNPIILRGIETIDASTVDTSLIGHSYFGDNRSIISDIYYLIRQRLRAHERALLEKVVVHEGQYWRFRH